jgi:uncharacterized membrane protein YkvA (DUF1232 family)
MAQWIDRWKRWAKQLKLSLYALYLAYRDPRTPWVAKVVAACVVGYAFSPIDLIPDFVPLLGYLDDLLLLPLGVALALRLIPEEVMADSRLRATQLEAESRPVNRVAAFIIITIWLALLALAAWAGYRYYKR